MQDGLFLRGLSREGFSKPLLKSFCNDVGEALRDSAHIVKTLASCPHLKAIFFCVANKKRSATYLAETGVLHRDAASLLLQQMPPVEAADLA